MTEKTFTIGAILSVTTGYMVAEDSFSQVHELLEFMMGGPTWTHQLPNACRKSKPWVLQQLPWTGGVEFTPDLEGLSTDDQVQVTRAWLAEQRTKFGSEFQLQPIPKDDQPATDPFREIPPHMDVVVVETKE